MKLGVFFNTFARCVVNGGAGIPFTHQRFCFRIGGYDLNAPWALDLGRSGTEFDHRELFVAAGPLFTLHVYHESEE